MAATNHNLSHALLLPATTSSDDLLLAATSTNITINNNNNHSQLEQDQTTDDHIDDIATIAAAAVPHSTELNEENAVATLSVDNSKEDSLQQPLLRKKARVSTH